MNRLVVLLGLLCIVAVDAHAAAVAVLPLAGRQASAERAAMTATLREELRSLDVDVLGGPETEQVITSASALGGTCAVTTAACALQLGGLAGVGTVVVGAVDSGQLTLRALDVASEREVGRVVLPIDVKAPRPTLRLAGIRLLRPDREVGQLAMFVDVEDAIVSIDGTVVGRTPLELQSLRPGPHEVVVSHPVHETQTFTVQAVLGETATLHVELAAGAMPTTSGRRPSGSDEFRQVVVLDVAPPVLQADRGTRLLAALTTLVLVDELQRLGGVIVVSPADVARAPGVSDVARCIDDECIRRVLGASFTGDVVVTGLVREVDGVTLVGRRLSLTTGRVAGPFTRRLVVAAPSQRQRMTGLVASLVGGLFADHAVREEMLPDTTLRERFAPPPVPLPAFIGTVGAVVAGAAVTGVTAVGWAGANAERDPSAALWGAGVVVGGVVTAAGLSAAIIESPFVDWTGLGAENDALLDTVAARTHSSR